MNSLVTKSTESAIHSGTIESLTTSIGLMAVILAAILLVERELIRTLSGPYSTGRVRAFSVVAIPLALTAFLIIIARLASLR